MSDSRVFKRKILKGEAYRKGNRQKQKIRVRLEQVLYLAAVDKDFRKELFRNREAGLKYAGIKLNEMEQATFSVATDEMLNQMIDAIRPDDHGRRKFMKMVATTTTALASGAATISCDVLESTSDGIDPQLDAGEMDSGVHDASRDARSDGADVDADADADADADSDADADVDVDGGGVDTGIAPDAGDDADVEADTGPPTHGLRPD